MIFFSRDDVSHRKFSFIEYRSFDMRYLHRISKFCPPSPGIPTFFCDVITARIFGASEKARNKEKMSY